MKKSLFKKLFAIVTLGVSTLAVQAVMPESGKIYRVINKSYGTAMTDRGPSGIVGCSDINNENMSQRWQITKEGNYYLFKSIGTGRFLTSSEVRSKGWTLSEGKKAMTITEVNGNYVIKAAGNSDQLAAHCDGSSNIVCWSADILPSQWDFQEIAMTQEEIDAALNNLANMEAEVAKASTYAEKLEALYTDKACTTLKSNYQRMTDAELQADANFKALSAPLQRMVLKTKNGDWSENYTHNNPAIKGDWDSEHAKKYRVQLYEPFSEGSAAAKLAEIQAYTNMNNPTGIVGNTGDVLYVMVEGQIKEGATLYMGSATGYGMFNNCTDGVQLHEGLNLVPIWSDMAHQFIYYTVNTVDWPQGDQIRAQRRHKVTDYDDIKIHIEGGKVNGFFNFIGDNLYTPDTDEDFRYTSQRAQFPMYDLLGKYVILHLFLFDTKADVDASNTSWGLLSVMDPEKNSNSSRQRSFSMTQIMKVWDDMCFRERTLMGIQSDEELARYNKELLWDYYEPLTGDKIEKHPDGDTWNTDPGFQYSDYFNNRMMGITMQGSLFMNATSWRTAYNITTLTAILCEIPYDSGSLWGPAHEYGHINQFPMKFAGTTEQSNNVFSNVAVYYLGLNTSRSSTPRNQLEIFNRDLTYLEHSTWGTTRMFLQLWLYYHACGNNKKFYPRLYELLRNNPRKQSYYLDMRYDQCHFAKMCCIAAQEDLTDFFESWGFFVPLENYHIGDYSNFYATLTKEDAQAVKDEIAALQLPKNDQIILIDDRPGVTDRDSWYESSMAINLAGKFGGLKDFRNKVKASGSMTFTIANGNLKITLGEGASAGVGFLIYDEDGTLLGFTNDTTCPLKKAAIKALMVGTGKVYAVSADGTRVEVANDYLNRPVSEHISNLRELVKSCKDVADYMDETGTKVGFYMPFFYQEFNNAYNAAKNVTDDATATEVTNLYLDLLNSYNAAKEQTTGRVPMLPGSTFKIHNKRFPNTVIAAAAKVATARNNKDTDDEYQQWVIEEKNDKYTFYNVKHQKYIGANDENPGQEAALPLVEKKSQAALFSMVEDTPGNYSFVYRDDPGYCIHTKGDSGTGTLLLSSQGWDASKWILRIIKEEPARGAQAKLQNLIAEAQIAYDEAGMISIDADPIALTEDMLSSNAKMQSGSDVFTSFNVLLDNDFSTYFLSNTNDEIDSDDGGNHYIQIDLGEGASTTSFQVSLSNRDTSRNGEEADENEEDAIKVYNPINMYVECSNDGTNFKRVATLQRIPSKSGNTYNSDILTDGTPYRIIRLSCIGSLGKAHNHHFFCISEIGLSNATETAKIKAQYPAVTQEMMFDLRSALTKATTTASATYRTPDNYNLAYDELLRVYKVLADAMGIQTAIDEITIDQDNTITANGIYDLQGRKVNKAGKGVYIINGVKTLVK